MRSYHSLKILWIIILLFGSVMLADPVQGQEQDDAAAQQNREVPGLDVILLVDESETMWNTTDPEGVRVNTVNFFIDILSTEQSSVGHRLAIIPFGSQPQVIPYMLLDGPETAEALKEQYAAVHAAIELEKAVQYTDINEALRAALTLLEQERDPTRKPALILISDGQPTNLQVSEDKGQAVVETYLEETQSLLEQLNQPEYAGESCPNRSGAPFFTIGIGVDNLQENSSPEFIALYRQFWQSVASRTNGYYREADRLQEMQGLSAYIFSELLCTPATPSLTFREAQTLEYQVYKSYYQIIFTFSGKDNPDLAARIYRPTADGSSSDTPLAKDAAGVSWQAGSDYEVWRISYTEPWEGTWQVNLEGEGQAEFSYVIFPNVTINLEEPKSGFLPVDRPVPLRATITDENGQHIAVPVDDFQVEIEGADVRKVITLQEDDEAYVAQVDGLDQTGEYSLTFSTILPDGSPLFEHKWVTLIAAPWAEIKTPAPDDFYLPADDISLEAEVHLTGAAPLNGVRMSATLLKDDETIQTIELSRGAIVSEDETERVVAYSGAFHPLETSGDYQIQAQLKAILPGGRVFAHETGPTRFSVLEPPTPTPSPSPSPTATPTALPAVVVAPTVTLAPTPVPTPGWSDALTFSVWPCLGLLFLLLLLAGLLFLWRRRQQEETPEKIKLLATLMKSRKENGQQPYLLILGSGDSIMLGSSSMRQIVEAVTEDQDTDSFHTALDSFSSVERYSLLKKHFEEADLSRGYLRLARLVEKGYFSLVFTTNLDSFLERSLPASNGAEPAYKLLICGKQPAAETLEILGREEPRVKIVKLHGDVDTQTLALTAADDSFSNDSEEVLRRYLDHDFIIIGHDVRDYDVNRAIEPKGGAIWYINPTPPMTDGPVYRAMRARRAETNIIAGEFGEFDRFFEALYKELMR